MQNGYTDCVSLHFQDCAVEISGITVSSLPEAYLANGILDHMHQGQKLQLKTTWLGQQQNVFAGQDIFVVTELYTAKQIKIFAANKRALTATTEVQQLAVVCKCNSQ